MKPVPDPASRLIINETKTWIRDQDLTFVASEADNYALEEALRLKEKHGGEVVVLAMGGEEAARVLRSGLAMGADRAIHLLDPKFKGADEFAAAAALAKGIEKDGGADLVLAGVQSDDLGTGMTGTMMAELLGIAHATVVVGVEEHKDNKLKPIAFELLVFAQRLSRDFGLPITAVVLGSSAEPLADELKTKKADRVLIAEHPDLVEYNPDSYVAVLKSILDR